MSIATVAIACTRDVVWRDGAEDFRLVWKIRWRFLLRVLLRCYLEKTAKKKLRKAAERDGESEIRLVMFSERLLRWSRIVILRAKVEG